MLTIILIQTHLLCWKQGINVFNGIEVSTIQRVLAGENLKIEQISYDMVKSRKAGSADWGSAGHKVVASSKRAPLYKTLDVSISFFPVLTPAIT